MNQFTIYPITPILDKSIRGLCAKPYPLHPKGCPNFNKCDRCPPAAPMFEDYFDLTKQVYAVINEFDFGGHVARMIEKHPQWSERQSKCVLYWQGTARKQLKEKLKIALQMDIFKGYESTQCPEGMGVNVTQTLQNIDISMEWPPEKTTMQIAFLAVRRNL